MTRPLSPAEQDARLEHLEHAVSELTSIPAADADRLRAHGVVLTPQQARIVGRLLRSPGKIVRRDALLQALDWDRPEPLTTGNVKVHIHRINRRLRGSPWHVENVWGHGYRIIETPAQPSTVSSRGGQPGRASGLGLSHSSGAGVPSAVAFTEAGAVRPTNPGAFCSAGSAGAV